jgi:hypothetical protein
MSIVLEQLARNGKIVISGNNGDTLIKSVVDVAKQGMSIDK